MTWDQFIAAVLGIAVTVIVRLVNKYLPPAEDRPVLAAAAEAKAEPMAGPPPAGYDAPTPPSAHELPTPDDEPTTGAPEQP